MEKEFIPYAEALALKELGFDEPCISRFVKSSSGLCKYEFRYGNPYNYNKLDLSLSRPTYSQAFRWFREKYDLHGKVGIHHFTENTYGYSIVSKNSPHYIHDESRFISYEEAELGCLIKLIEIVKENTNLPEVDETIDGSRI
jgi:hypothetical protein